MSDYIYEQGWTEERRRLDALGSLYDAWSISTLTHLGLSEGWRCWEIGGGSGTITRALSGLVGADGSVLATDLDTRFLEMIEGENVEIRRHDVLEGPPAVGAFDLVHARAVLEHIPERSKALANIVSATRSGGFVFIEDVFFPPPISDPENATLTKVIRAFEAGFRLAGADPYYGIRVPNALVAAGLVDVAYESHSPVVATATSGVDFLSLSLEHLADRFVSGGFLDEAEVAEVIDIFARPGTTLMAPTMIGAWGRKP